MGRRRSKNALRPYMRQGVRRWAKETRNIDKGLVRELVGNPVGMSAKAIIGRLMWEKKEDERFEKLFGKVFIRDFRKSQYVALWEPFGDPRMQAELRAEELTREEKERLMKNYFRVREGTTISLFLFYSSDRKRHMFVEVDSLLDQTRVSIVYGPRDHAMYQYKMDRIRWTDELAEFLPD